MQQFFVGIEYSDIIVGQRRMVQQAMRKMNTVYTTADDQQLEHCRLSPQ
jgi:hypothetical protein